MLDKTNFLKLIGTLCEMYDKQLTEMVIDIYYEAWKEFEYEDVKKAVNIAVADRVYSSIPKPGEILQYLTVTRQDKPTKAWLQVLEAIRKGGYYRSFEFADKVIPYCIEALGGWMWICQQQKDEFPFIEKRFKDFYRVFSLRDLDETPKVIGFIEASNSEKGYDEHIPKIIRIGFEDDVKLIEKKEVIERSDMGVIGPH